MPLILCIRYDVFCDLFREVRFFFRVCVCVGGRCLGVCVGVGGCVGGVGVCVWGGWWLGGGSKEGRKDVYYNMSAIVTCLSRKCTRQIL